MTDAPLMLSVSGARGIVGASMTPDVAKAYAAAFGSHVAGDGPIVCLGRDTRSSSESLANGAADGLASTGASVIDLGVVPTPTVAVMVTERQAAGGLMITASHNPDEWNGIKCIGPDGMALPADGIDAVVRRFKNRDFLQRDPGPPARFAGEQHRVAGENLICGVPPTCHI